jgi:hypothetical protein
LITISRPGALFKTAAALDEARQEIVEWMSDEISPDLGVHSGPGIAGVC